MVLTSSLKKAQERKMYHLSLELPLYKGTSLFINILTLLPFRRYAEECRFIRMNTFRNDALF